MKSVLRPNKKRSVRLSAYSVAILVALLAVVPQTTKAEIVCYPYVGCFDIPTTPPGTPSSITAPATVTHATAGAWAVSWGASSGSLTGLTYELWESALGGSYARIYAGTARTHNIAGKTLGGTYTYRARACNSMGCSGYTAVRNVSLTIGTATTLVVPATNTSGSYTATWASQDNGAGTGTTTLEEKVGSGSWTFAQDATTTTSKSYSNKPTGTYSYRLRYQFSGCYPYVGCINYEQSQLPKTVVVTRAPAAVATPALTNKSGNTDTTFTISWNASSGATGYKLYRRQAVYGGSYGGWALAYNGSGRTLNQTYGNGHYQYRVRACNASCGGYSGIRTATVLTLPGTASTPAISSKTNNADKSFLVSWGASGRVTRYELYRRQATYGSSSYGSWALVQNSIAISLNQTLGNGHYQYYARACNESGCSGNSPAATTTVLTLPGTPSVPAVSNKSSNSDTAYNISWNAGSGVNDRYQLQRRQAAYGSSSYGAWATIHNAIGRNIVDTQTANGHYQYRVRGHNASGYSAFTGVRTVTVLNASGVPGAISVSGSSNGSRDADGNYTVTWTAAGGVVDRYELQRRQAAYTTGTPAWSSWTVVQNNSNRSLAESGKADGHYRYRVRACNGSGCSAFTAVRTQDVLHVPAAPTSISGPADSDGRFVLSVGYGSGHITSYKLQHAVNGGSTWTDQETGSGRPTSISLTRPAYDSNHQPTENYRFRIAACNISGCSAYSASSNNIHINPPGTPASISLSGVSHQTADADGSYRLAWSAISNAEVTYTVEEVTGAGAWTAIASDRTVLYLDIQRTTQNDYQYRVKACLAGVGCGDTTNSVSVKVAFMPSVPATPTVGSSHSVPNSSIDGSFTLFWVKPSGTVSHYRIYRNNVLALDNVSGTSRTFTNQADADDTYQVAACNDVVCSGASGGRVVQLLRTPGVPGAMQGPANSAGDGGFALTWAASSGSVARYETQRGAEPWRNNGTSRQLSESGLADGAYSYRVRACNVLSCSASSATKAVSVYNAPGTPGQLSGPASSQTGSFDLNWGEASGTVTRYVLEEQDDDGVNWTVIQSDIATTATVTDLESDNYRYRVAACNGPNCGGRSNSHDVEVVRAPPVVANPLDSVAGYVLPASDTGVGATGANHEVGVDGSASYSIPIPAAGGRGGLTPELALVYTSNGGNSELGVGWDIAGLSRIYRCGSNFTLDGRVDGINFDSNDKLCMDGQRLVVTNGVYGVSGAEYETLRDSQSKIESLGVEGGLSGADSAVAAGAFKVRIRDGRTLYFGGTPDSRLSRVTTTYACSNFGNLGIWGGNYCATLNSTTRSQTYQWLINRIEDRHGNTIEFTYENVDSTGEQRVSEVSYNDGLHRIAFTWQARPDVTQAYFAGALLKQAQRLEKVTSYSDTTAMRSLHVGYENTGSTARSKINQITECAGETIGTDCLVPTTFQWQQGEAGYTRSTSNISQYSYVENRVPMAADINGDGFSDILSSAENTWRIALGGTNSLTDWHVTSTTVTDDDRNYALALRYNNDVRDDLLIRRGGFWYVLLADSNATGFLPAQSTGIPSTGYNHQPKVLDVNGDGRGDLVFRGSNANWHYRLMGTNGFGVAVDTGRSTVSDESRSYTMVMDYNGDGLQDLLVPHNSYYKVYQSTGSGFRELYAAVSAADYRRQPRVLDLNGDGLSDMLFRTGGNQIVYVLNKGGAFSARTTVTGLTATEEQWKRAQVLDYNGDGRSEMWINGQFVHCDDQGMATQAVVVSSAAAHISGTIPGNRHTVALDYNGDSLDDLVVLGAGSGNTYRYTHKGLRPDYLTSATNGMGVETQFEYRGLHDGSDLLANADDEFYLKEGESLYPVLAESSAAYVVSKLSQSNGIGGFQSTSYKYRGLRSHIAGLGSLGFARMITQNDQTGIRTEVSFSHNYSEHRQGTITRVETIAGNDTVLSLTLNDWDTIWTNSLSSGVNAQRHRIVLQQNTVSKRDLNGAFLHHEVSDYVYDTSGNAETLTSKVYSDAGASSLLRTSVTVNTWHNDTNAWLIGLLSRAEVTVTDHSQNAPPLKRVSSFDFDPVTGMNLGEQIRHPQTDVVLVDTRFGEDINGQLQRDSFGNLLATTINGPDFVARSQSVVYDSAHGLNPTESRDAQSNVTRHEYYGVNEFGSGAYPGKVKITTAPNGVKTHIGYDSFGRVSEVTRAYGTAAAVKTNTRYRWCTTNCRASAVYVRTSFTDGGSPVHTEFDELGRTIRSSTLAIDGRDVYVDSDFDHMGHNTHVSEPYFAGDATLWNQIRFDDLGRAIETTEPNGRVDTVGYNGLTTTSHIDVFGENQSKVEVRDSLNNLLSVTDNDQQAIRFGYDSLARQTRLTDPASNQITIGYNVLDQKIVMSDPDKGNWSYTYNGLGQLITQTDAKGQTTCTAYDTLDRQVKRVDLYTGAVASDVGQNAAANQQCSGSGGDTTVWNYNTSGNGLGQVASVSSPEYLQQNGYDTVGRPNLNTTTIKAESFTTNTSFDALGRPDVLSYPASTGSHARLAVKQRYNALGYHTGTYNLDGTVLYSRPEAVDARGNVTNTYLGNNVRTDREYDPLTGYLERIYSQQEGVIGLMASVAGEAPVQDMGVDFDAVGNLIHRSDFGSGFVENYNYDTLNRLTDAWSDYGNGNTQHTEVRYDALGNIGYKSGVGQYDYGTQESNCGRIAGPHAVTQITPLNTGDTKTASYCYDANGNMTAGDGRSFGYTSFDKPDYIEKGGHSTAMQYGAGRQLVYRHDVDTASGTDTESYLLGGLYERVRYNGGAASGKIEERHYVAGAIVTYSHDSAGNEQRNPTDERRRYTHSDHLGSIVAITDEIGRVVERLSFDAWGKRRAVEQPSLDDLLAVDPYNFLIDAYELKSRFTDRGFTGHQQLDGVGIVHMGGRIYDAEIGRFLQADPFVQDRTNLQGLNRYSYVENNPLSFTDPSGYFLKKLFKKIGRIISGVFKAIGNALKGVFRAIGRVKWLSTVISVALNFVPGCQAWCSAAFNSAMAHANGASFGDILKGAAIGMVTSWVGGDITHGLGKTFGVEVTRAAVRTTVKAFAVASAGQAIAAGIAAKIQGRKFIDGLKQSVLVSTLTAGFKWVKGDFAEAKAEPGNSQKQPETLKEFAESQVEQRQANEDYTIKTEVARGFGDLPSNNFSDSGGLWSWIASRLGLHKGNQRLEGGYHFSTERAGGRVNLHFDAIDPMIGPIHAFFHMTREVLPLGLGHLDSNPVPATRQWTNPNGG